MLLILLHWRRVNAVTCNALIKMVLKDITYLNKCIFVVGLLKLE